MIISFAFQSIVIALHTQLSRLVESMTANPPLLVPGWTIGKNQTLALLHNNQWFRGVAVRKTGDKFSVYRVDLGDVVTVPKNSLRPLPAPFCRWTMLNEQIRACSHLAMHNFVFEYQYLEDELQ